MLQLTLGFSSCPNDTFIFDALLHGKIDTEGLSFIPVIEDVETLNKKANDQLLDITKLSYHAYAYLIDKYVLLDAGSALGFGVGPLLISKQPIANIETEISKLRIGIPGKLTTANFLLSIAFPQAQNKVEMLFSSIENALINDEIDLGLIIHENRFTYEQKGLHKIIDLGNFWESQTKAAIPLGGIVMSRKFDLLTIQKVNRVLRKSVEFAFANPKSSFDFVKLHSQEMSEEVMYKHIELYVNKYSINLGDVGRNAVNTLMQKANELSIIPKSNYSIFVE